MKKISFCNTYGLTQAVKDGLKTMTRRLLFLSEADEEYLNQAFDWDLRESVILDRYAKYKVGEVVAVAEAYRDVYPDADFKMINAFEFMTESAGWKNKMYVLADLMPTKILFTERKIERLRSISDEDCFKEGLKTDPITGWYYFPNLYTHRKKKDTAGPTLFENPKYAYLSLCKKLRMVLDDSANPWVVAYTFKNELP